MSTLTVATRYGDALLQEANKQGTLDVVFQDFEMVQRVVKGNRDLGLLLKSPIVKSDKKLAVVKAIFGDKVSELSDRFLALLIRKRREGGLNEIIEAFFQAYNDLKNIKEVEVISATELNDELLNQIVSKIKTQMGGANLKVTKTIDSALLGGFIIKIGDKVFDTSLHNKLNTLKKEIIVS